MAVCETRFYSETLLQDVTVAVVLPLPSASNMELGKEFTYLKKGEKFPVLWLLPTGTADHSKGIRSSRIEEYAMNKKIAVVMPDLGNSLGFNLPLGGSYFDYLTKELPLIMRSIYPLSGKREDNFIGGASNGGFTSYMAALRKPENYAGAFCIGCSLDMNEVGKIKNSKFWYEKIMPTIYGKDREYYDPHIHDMRTLADDLVGSNKERPKFYATFGLEDIYIDCGGVAVAEYMKDCGLDVTIRKEHGIHDWEFWDPELKKALDWLADLR